MDTKNWRPSKELKSTFNSLLKIVTGNSFNYDKLIVVFFMDIIPQKESKRAQTKCPNSRDVV
jgi:hypothetical protein